MSGSLPVKTDIPVEVCFPTLTDFVVVRENKVHHVRKVFLVELAAVAREHAAAIARQPNLGCSCGRTALRNMNVHGLTVLTRPEKDGETLEEEEPRHNPSTPPERAAKSAAHCCGQRSQDARCRTH